jgi:nitrate reductase gamma subunit
MAAYILRRLAYAVLILAGVNLLTFTLFFAINSPDNIARLNIGGKRVTAEAIAKWKAERGYDKPLWFNGAETGFDTIRKTIFYDRSLRLFTLNFGSSDAGRDIAHEIAHRIGPSLALMLPMLALTVIVGIAFSLLLVFFRTSYLDFWGTVACVLMMSISSLFYIIMAQWFFGKLLRVVPISGFAPGLDLAKFLLLPVIVGIVWMIRAAMVGSFFPVTEEGKIVYGNLFPGDFTIDPIFGLTALFVLICFAVGVRNLIEGFKSTVTDTFVIGYKKPTIKEAIIDAIKYEVLQHTRFKDCIDEPADEERVKGHLLLFYGFVACFIVTSIVAVAHWGGKIVHFLEPIGHTPMPLWSPVKILANVGAVLLLTGLTLLTRRRLNLERRKSRSNYYDWYLLGVIWAVTLTGIGSEVFRLAAVAPLAFFTYYLHLVSIFMLIAYLPWSKLGHLVYRTTALIYARYVGRLPIGEKLIEDEKVFVI